MVGARGGAGRHCAAAPAGVRCLATEVGHVPRHQVSKIEGDGEMLTGLWKKEKNGRRGNDGGDRRRRRRGVRGGGRRQRLRASGLRRSSCGVPAMEPRWSGRLGDGRRRGNRAADRDHLECSPVEIRRVQALRSSKVGLGRLPESIWSCWGARR